MTKHNNKLCRLLMGQLPLEREAGLLDRLLARVPTITFDTPWVQRHIATCNRCRRRFAGTGKVMLALSCIRCTPMNVGLLSRANTKAISRLHRSLRQQPKADALRLARPQPSLSYRLRQVRGSLTQLAACLAIMILGRVGLFSSMRTAHQVGTKAMNQYYARYLGQDIADRIYPQS